MKRLFAFGCSYTSYCWPSWADYLSSEFDEYFNWAYPGIGNRAIAERVAEAHVKHHFTKDDVIIVQWSTHLRHDWFHMTSLPDRPGTWKTSGSIFNYINSKIFDQKWINLFFFEPAYFMHTLNSIVLVQNLIKSTGASWYMTSVGDIRNLGADLHQSNDYKECITERHEKDSQFLGFSRVKELEIYNKPIWEDHKDHWLTPLSIFEKSLPSSHYVFYDKTTNKPFNDLHLTPHQHINWIESELKDKLNVPDSSIIKYKEVADAADAVQQKFVNDERQYTATMRTNSWMPIDLIVWPPTPHGF